MIYNEKRGDIFELDTNWVLGHCISADYKMGKGIALEFNEHFNMKYQLIKDGRHKFPAVVGFDNLGKNKDQVVFNIVTKEKFRDKPTYSNFRKSIELLKEDLIDYNFKRIALPKIGTGLDGLKWATVKRHIHEVFEDTDIEILIIDKNM